MNQKSTKVSKKKVSLKSIYEPYCVIVTRPQLSLRNIKDLAVSLVKYGMEHAIAGKHQQYMIVRPIREGDPEEIITLTPDVPVIETFDGKEYRCI